ncbi:hypothetical protein NN3_51490 [Nocardia neocaledoniensis NBRC 108232]|nr:hypothetical protein NN3_51490 [Nocardia neocaledoniensis NBRC 108232]
MLRTCRKYVLVDTPAAAAICSVVTASNPDRANNWNAARWISARTCRRCRSRKDTAHLRVIARASVTARW